MSALWTPGRAGASPGSLRQSPESPSRVHPHRPLLDVCAWSRWSWLDASTAQNWLKWARVGLLHEGRDPLAKGCAYCTKAPPTQSALHPPPVAPHPRALHPDDTGNHQSDRGSPDPTGRSSSSPVRQAHPTGVLRCHDIRNSQKPRDNSVGLISTVSACRRTSVAGSGCASRSPRWRRPRPLAPRTRA